MSHAHVPAAGSAKLLHQLLVAPTHCDIANVQLAPKVIRQPLGSFVQRPGHCRVREDTTPIYGAHHCLTSIAPSVIVEEGEEQTAVITRTQLLLSLGARRQHFTVLSLPKVRKRKKKKKCC